MARIVYDDLIVNPGFESNSGSDVTPTGYTLNSGGFSVLTVDGSLNAFEGSNFLSGNSSSITGEVEQVIDLVAGGVSADSIDNGHCTADFTSRRSGAGDNLDEGRVLVEFLNAADVVQGTLLDTGLEAIDTINTWFERSASTTAIPATTRKIRIRLSHNKQPAGSISNAAFDALGMNVIDNEGAMISGPRQHVVNVGRAEQNLHTDPNFEDVHLLLGFDNDADAATTTSDEGPLNTSVTFTGAGAEVDDAQAKFKGNSLLLGSNAYLSIPNSDGVSVANAFDKTYEAWIRPTTSGLLRALFNKRDAGDAEEFRFMITAGNVLELVTWDAPNVEDINISGTTTIDTNRWYHVAASRASGVWRLFLDGNLEASGTQDGTPGSNTSPLRIGSSAFNASRFFTGHMDEIRITHGFARYTANFNPPIRKFPRS